MVLCISVNSFSNEICTAGLRLADKRGAIHLYRDIFVLSLPLNPSVHGHRGVSQRYTCLDFSPGKISIAGDQALTRQTSNELRLYTHLARGNTGVACLIRAPGFRQSIY